MQKQIQLKSNITGSSLSWAPRWRLLELIEQNINPFEDIEKQNIIEEDYELNEIVDDFSEE